MLIGRNLLRFATSSALLVCGLVFAVAKVNAQSPHAEVEWALDDQSLAVAWVDPAKADFAAVEELLTAVGLPKDEGAFAQAATMRDALVSAKVTRVYGLLDLGVIATGKPTVVFLTKDPEATRTLVNTIVPSLDGMTVLARESAVILGSADRVETLTSDSEKESNKNLSESLKSAVGDHGLVTALPKSSRDMIGILLKSRPNSSTEDDGSKRLLEFLRKFEGGRFLVDEGKKDYQLQVDFDSSSAASEFGKIANDAIGKDVKLSDDLRPVVKDKSVHWNVDSLDGLKQLLKSMPLIRQAREEAATMQKMNNLKQVGLAFHNFESAYRTFVPQALASKDGKRLLSWRVMILPFIEQAELYNQFHFDEPWDSEHNLKLAAKMPKIYGEDKSGKGLTSVQVLLTPDSAFGRKGKPLHFADITDGTSNTIWLTEVDPSDAVVWTKPEDYNVVSEEAYKKLFANREKVPFGFLDGSIRLLSKNLGFEMFTKAVTIDGGEVIELP